MATATPLLDLRKPVLLTMESFAHLKMADLVSDDGSVFDMCLINCDIISRNRTMYPLEDIVNSMNDRRVQERIENKCFYGEAEHPCSDTEEPLPLKRMMRVEPSRWVWRIDNWRVQGSDIMGTVTWAGKYGEMYQKELLRGTNFAASIRAYTPNYVEKDDANGKYVIKKHLMFIASYDCVTVPGLEGARIMNPGKYASLTRNDKLTVRQYGDKLVKSNEAFSEIAYSNVIAELRDMMTSQESAKMVSDMFGIDAANADMFLRSDNVLSVRSSEGQLLDLPLSRTLLSTIL